MSRLSVIALMGKSKSGKDTFGQMLLEAGGPGGGVSIAFADKLKQVCADVFDVPLEEMYSEAGKAASMGLPCLVCPLCKSIDCKEITIEREKNAACSTCGAVGELRGFLSEWTRRTVLQYIGTEGFRRIDPSVWVKHALRTARAALTEGVEIVSASDSKREGVRFISKFVVITDCRFRSEMDAVLAGGGEVWRIKRPLTDDAKAGIGGHQSETEMDSIPDDMFQRVIVNDGSLEQLKAKAAAALASYLRPEAGVTTSPSPVHEGLETMSEAEAAALMRA